MTRFLEPEQSGGSAGPGSRLGVRRTWLEPTPSDPSTAAVASGRTPPPNVKSKLLTESEAALLASEAGKVQSPARQDEEDAMLSEAFYVKQNSRLGCQIPITPNIHGLEVELAPES